MKEPSLVPETSASANSAISAFILPVFLHGRDAEPERIAESGVSF